MSDDKNLVEPLASRPYMPGYGVEQAADVKGLLPWSWAEERLTLAHTYWLATTRPDGRPHLMPIWGIWLDRVFWFSTGRRSRKSRNVAANPECVISLEQSRDSVIIEGVAGEIEDAATKKKCFEAYTAKYEWNMEASSEPLFAVRPRIAFGFTETGAFEETATRWTFQP